MSKLPVLLAALLLLATALLPAVSTRAQDGPPPAVVENDEGGPNRVTGTMNYTDPSTVMGVAEPLIVLEDQGGFVDRDYGFLLPLESQVLGAITGDFFDPPFTWSLALPAVPAGTLRDVDNDGEEDKGVMTFAVAYWSNTFGDPYLEERDLYGGGWSTAYATTRVKPEASGGGEVIGGQYIVYAPDDQQGFPSGFGDDGKLFTADDPIVRLPQGYTLVNMDADPFTFDRSQAPELELYEPESIELEDFSGLAYPEAFDAMIEMMRKEYAFTAEKQIDWDAIQTDLRPLFEQAQADNDNLAYRRALRAFFQRIPDGHMARQPFIAEDFQALVEGGLGVAIRELDDGRLIVNYVTEDSPAAQAGIQLGAELLTIADQPAGEFVSTAEPYSAPFSTEHVKRLQQLRYATRAPVGSEVAITFRNPDAAEPTAATLTAAVEDASFLFSAQSLNLPRSGVELPVDFSLLDNGLGYVKVNSFSDNSLLTVQLWETMMRQLNQRQVPGLIIDMRQNGGGLGFLADQMAAYFFDEPLELGLSGSYDKDKDAFYFDENRTRHFYLPDESLRYAGDVAVIAGPNCNSACEFFADDLTLQGRAQIVGSYPTAGMAGGQKFFLMPDFEYLQFSAARPIDTEGNLRIEGTGVVPTLRVPVTEETLFYQGDLLLDSTIALLQGEDLPFAVAPMEETVVVPAGDEAPAAPVTEVAGDSAPAISTEIVTATALAVEPEPMPVSALDAASATTGTASAIATTTVTIAVAPVATMTDHSVTAKSLRVCLNQCRSP